jgi:hypothetical protein|tara:strand:- start:423 stop:740 length:318 start_codon:yes stop_codon:yes gene_type:complete
VQKLRLLYTENEIILCTYIALYGKGLLVEKKIASYGKRPENSVIMKIQNIAAMLDDKGIERCSEISPLSGKTTGESGRETDWPIVEKLVAYKKKELWQKCKEILA